MAPSWPAASTPSPRARSPTARRSGWWWPTPTAARSPSSTSTSGRCARPSPGATGDHVRGDSAVPVVWRVHREVVGLAGWGSAILAQLAHPAVARAVADHSGFREGWAAPWRRLARTLDAMLALTFGPDEEAERAARRINAVHD